MQFSPHKICQLLALLIFLFTSVQEGLCNETILIENPEALYALRNQIDKIEYLEDLDKSLTIEQVHSEVAENRWKKIDLKKFSSREMLGRYWLRFRLQFSQNLDPTKWRLSYGPNGQVCYLALYMQGADKSFVHFTAGTTISDKIKSGRGLIKSFPIPKGKRNEIMTYIATDIPYRTVPHFLISTETKLNERSSKVLTFLGICFGAMAIMCIYNLFLFAFIRDKSYLYYVIFTLGMLFYYLCWYGYFQTYISNGYPALNHYILLISSFYPSTVFLLFFTRSILDTPKFIPRFDKFIVTMIVLFCSIAPLYFYSVNFVQNVALLAGPVLLLTLLVAGVLCLRKTRSAIYFLLSNSFFIGGMLIFIWSAQGIIGMNLITEHGGIVGTIFELSFFSIGLAAKINAIKDEKQQAQESAKQYSRALKVTSAATEAIQLKKEQLENQLTQAAKMASIGELAAGIAHEINNPLAIVSGYMRKIEKLTRSAGQMNPSYVDAIDAHQRAVNRIRARPKITYHFSINQNLEIL